MLAPLVTAIGLSEMCFSGPVAAGLVLLADERVWGAAVMGWIASAFSVGAAAAALLLAVGPASRAPGRRCPARCSARPRERSPWGTRDPCRTPSRSAAPTSAPIER
ncbi:hypothetical protein [Streptomyces sp. KL115B]|uniref:hypothetical protein n=1 Tax=Streptomyces sp. KL115B TaxID=3045154 RepID=UPI00353242F4